MGRERDNEKKFSEYLDRILAGEEIKADPFQDAGLRSALEFARKMAALGATPTAPFQARLKADLLRKLEEQEARPKAAKGSFWEVFKSHPAWQGAAAALLVILALAIVWRAGVFQPSVPITIPTTTPAPSATKTVPPVTTAAPTTPAPWQGIGGTLISIDAVTDKPAYQAGEPVEIELAMKNISQKPLTVEDFPPILSVMSEDTNQPVYTFTAGKTAYTLAPNDVVKYTYTWTQVDFKGQPVTGAFYIELEDLEYNGAPIKLNLNNPVNFEVLSSKIY